ncbi:NADH-quinone oxidoreductase subunit I [Desulfurobacterium pacificum]|jgi:NADH-quinone oxidoreductase subunit I|uniref:NADH-quinone oxidoreductase subunit I n=1 Tax=Desulfurobacterium pacificum TaxID=240166 RepID=A0ABY1NK54_9BACT|nr:4Fe-4S binding protein [Desulfurobacterium pacificum]SMP11650.1 NADH-quinone oxidoreductase subunit I [Desulfurobacterium pacificum]
MKDEMRELSMMPVRALQKVVRVSKALFREKATEIWWDKGIKRELHYRGKHVIKAELCIGCSLCARSCPVNCIEMVPTGVKKPRAVPKVRASECIFCGLCEDACPTKPQKAIQLTDNYSMLVEPGTWDRLTGYVFEPENLEAAIEKAKKMEELIEKKKQEALKKKQQQEKKDER